MAYTVITRPADLSLSGNIADFVLDSNAPVTFKLAVGGKVILDEIYTPTSAGAITIKLRKVIEQQLTLSIPTSDFFEQSKSVIYFLATIDTIDYGFRVVKGGVDANVLDAATYLSQNFLTWQPQSKQVKLNDPEWLTYFSALYATKVVKAKGYYLDNTTETIVAYTIDEEPKCWTMNVQYALLAGKFTAAPSYIDVWVEDSNGVRLTFIQRYILQADFDEFDDLFVFENSLGGIDTIRYTGTLQEINDPDVASAIFGEETMEFGLDVDRYFSKNTGGFKSERHQQWAVDFFNSYNRYRIADGVVRRIVLRKADIKGVKRDVNSFSFNFAYTKQTNRLNLARFDTLPDVIEMVDPNSELFFLAPRLSEFPTAPLAYNFLFPIQSPYEKKWYKASIYEIANLLTTEGGVGQNALDSEKWNGHRWDDYMEQALKKASDVEFHNAKVNNLQAADTVINSLVSALYQSGFNGNGFKIDADGNAEVKSLMVRDQLTVLELVVQKLRSIGGMIILSSANGKATKVELKENSYYRITLDTTGTLTHSFVVDDFVKCQRFNGGVKSYWKRVIAIGTDYIDITKDSGEGTGIPENGDEIVQLGNTTDTSRQNAIILDATALPRIDIYQGINSYSLEGKLKSRLGDLSEQGINGMGLFTSQGKFTGQVVIGGGSTGYENFTDKPDLSLYPLMTYVNGAFKDGVISQAEASAIEKYKAQVNAAFNDTIATYNVIYANAYLEGTAKTDLLNAKVTMAGAKDNLITSITNAISDGKTTTAEKTDVDAKYALWDSALSTYKSKLEAANKAIQQKLDAISKGYVDGVVIGGSNLITNSRNFKNTTGWTNYSNVSAIAVEADATYGSVITATGASTLPRLSIPNFAVKEKGSKSFVFSAVFSAANVNLVTVGGKTRNAANAELTTFVATNHIYSSLGNGFTKLTCLVTSLPIAADTAIINFYLYTGAQTIKVVWVKVEEGTKATEWSPSTEDLDAAILDAKTAGTAAQNSANTANESIGSLNSYVDGAFKDGVIDSSEAKAIDKLNKQINIDYDKAINDYNVVYANAYLEGTAKTDFLNAKINLVSAKDALQTSINTAIADGKATTTEKADVDSKFATYANNFKDYQTKLSNANKAIQQKLDAISKGYVDGLQIGGRNLYKKTTAISTLLGTPVIVRDNGTDPDCVNGFKIAGASGVTCGVRLQDVITKNGSYVISFWGKSNGTPALSMDIADNNVSGGLVFSSAWKKFVVKVTVANYDATYDFLDINNIPWVTIWFKDFKIEEGTKETDWSPAPEDISSDIIAAQTAANDAATAATAAQTSATAANNLLAEIADDNKLSPPEKQQATKEWNIIISEKTKIDAQADVYAVSKYAYGTAYSALSSYITPLLANLSTTDAINGATFRANFKAYYDARQDLLNAISTAAKTLANTAQSTADTATLLAKAMNSGKVLYTDPNFKTGYNGINVYNNSGGTAVTVVREAASADSPNGASGFDLNITYAGGSLGTSPGLGGFRFATQTRAGAIFVVRFIAKIPTGYYLSYAGNSIGTGASTQWLTSNYGTGLFQEYVYLIKCGTSGTFSTSAYFALNGTATPGTTWRLAMATVYDITDSDIYSITASATALADMAADGKLTPAEKLEIKRIWLAIQASYSNTCQTADQAGWAHDDLDDAFVLLSAYINPLLSSMTTTSTIVRDTFNANINNYLREEAEVRDAVTLAVNTAASNALNLATSKSKHFTSQPTTPYALNDTWTDGVKLYKCVLARATGAYTASDWAVAVTYDNTQTTINSGVVTSGTIQLGSGDGSATYIKAGITGQGDTDGDVRIWAGAAFVNRAYAPFKVLQSGEVFARKRIELRDENDNGLAGICGANVAGDGGIRFWAGSTYANRATAPFRVDKDGVVVMTKTTLSTSDSGKRIVISSSDGTFKFIASNGSEALVLKESSYQGITYPGMFLSYVNGVSNFKTSVESGVIKTTLLTSDVIDSESELKNGSINMWGGVNNRIFFSAVGANATVFLTGLPSADGSAALRPLVYNPNNGLVYRQSNSYVPYFNYNAIPVIGGSSYKALYIDTSTGSLLRGV